MKAQLGTLFRRKETGMYYFQYSKDHKRKRLSLKTKDKAEAEKIVDALWNVPNERVGPLVQCVVSMGDCELALQLIQLLGNADGIFTKDAVKLFSGFFIRLEYGSRLDNSKSNKIFVQFILGLNEQQRVDVVSALQHVWDSGLLSRLSYIF